MFITLEGIDGSGKTTQANLLYNYFKNQNQKVILTKEPGGGSDFALHIRKLLSTSDSLELSDLLAIYAARNEHLEKLIKPALKNGDIIICDRFLYSSIAYFCYNKNYQNNSESRKIIDSLNEIINLTIPDITFYFDVDVKIAKERILQSSNHKDKYDSYNDNKVLQIKEVFDYLANQKENKIIKINANQSESNIFDEIIRYLIKQQ